MNLFSISRRMSLMRAWNTARALMNPKAMTMYSKCLMGVLYAVFYLSPSLSLTRWSAFLRSSLENTLASQRGSKEGSMRGSGYLFLRVMPFNPRKSMQ